MNFLLTPTRLLSAWDVGSHYPTYIASRMLLQQVWPADTELKPEELTVGQRDRHLLKIRELCFGNQMDCIEACPHCSEKVEFSLQTQAMYQEELLLPSELDVELNGFQVTYRLPVLGDLERAGRAADPKSALLDQCLIQVRKGDVEIDTKELPEDVLHALIGHIEEADPQARIELNLLCATCGSKWVSTFDIVSFLWKELGAWAHRILHEVHLIAQAYGWSESETLSLSPYRRQLYIKKILGSR